MILLLYNVKMCREILLPNLYNSDYTVRLSAGTYGLAQELTLQLEAAADGWILKSGGSYEVFAGSEKQGAYSLENGEILTLRLESGENVRLIVTDTAFSFLITEKYSLSGMSRISIGKNESNMICYDFLDLISGSHAELERHSDGWYITDLSSNGTFDNHGRIQGRRRLQFGDHLHIFGLHIIFLGEILAVGAYYGTLQVDGNVLRNADRTVGASVSAANTDELFNRSPRTIPSLYGETVEIEKAPDRKEVRKKPWFLVVGPSFTMAIPMVIGFSLLIWSRMNSGTSSSAFMYTGIITVVGSALLGAFWAAKNLQYTRREEAEDEKNRFNAYSNYLIGITETLEKQYSYNAEVMRGMYPSASVCCSYGRHEKMLWSRNQSHGDFLFHRIGMGDRPFQVKIEIPKEKFTVHSDSLLEKPRMIREQFETLHQVPVGLSFLEKQLIGLVGGHHKAGAVALMHAIVADIAANHSYTDVKFVFLYDESDPHAAENWSSMRWFPHVWSEDRQMRFLASDEVERRDVLFALSNIIRSRVQEEGFQKKATIPKPYYLLFVSDPKLLSGELLARYIYQPRRESGMTTFLMTESVEQLPNVCEEIIENDRDFQGYYNLLEGQLTRKSVQLDTVTPKALEDFGRRLAGIRVGENEITSEIPQLVDFLSMYGVRTLDEFVIEERWRKNRTYKSMRALIGKKSGGADCYLDVHEKYHGPHGLIAGTTGSGKSETLQTYILSLAVNFSPEDVAFFLIDFKGGGMANLFSDLPHLAGQITNLSGNQIRRAMISIKSENTRRQRIFSEYGVNNINLYTRLYKENEAKEPVPHLFIIIDEFAELKKEEPDFMRELISVAQVGRSLGVHLILATQKPSGTVDDNIRSNSRFRLCLRVQDKQDSSDMLHKPDAAFITQTGRGYLQVGSDEIYEIFQSGWSQAPYVDAEGIQESSVALLSGTGREVLAQSRVNRYRREKKAKGGTETIREVTQLTAVVGYLKQKAEELGYRQAVRLWLPVLEDEITLSELYSPTTEQSVGTAEFTLSAAVGMYDDPRNQKQAPLIVDFAAGGNLTVCGAVASGKSTFLQTLLYALFEKYDPDRLQCYILDYSSHLLAPFEHAPNTGGIVFDNQADRLDKCMNMIAAMMDERAKLLRGGNYAQYVQSHGQKLPAVLLVIDNIGSMRDKSGMKYDDLLMRYVREGIGCGMYLAVTASGYGMSELPVRIAENMKTVISLEQGDKFKYMDIMRVTRLDVYPDSGIRGRGLAVTDGRILEFQTAVSVAAESDFERGRILESLFSEKAEAWIGARPRPIPEIPENPTLANLFENEAYQKMAAGGDCIPFAYDLESASIFGAGLRETYCYTISGRAHTGKTNVLKLLIYGASLSGGQLYVIEPQQSELKKAAGECGASYMSDMQEVFEFYKELTPVFVERNKKKKSLAEQGLDETQIYTQMRSENPIFIFISDLKEYFDMVYKADRSLNLSGFMETILERGSLHRIYFFGCLKTDDAVSLRAYKAYQSYVSSRKGIHLGGSLSAQKLFNFQNVPFSELGRNMKKGMAYAADEEDETVGIRIVVPVARLQSPGRESV